MINQEFEILGVDIGNCFVKTSENVIFPSKISEYTGLNENAVIFDNRDMLIGEGEYETDLNKSTKRNILPLLYKAINDSTECDFVKVVLGLPLNQYLKHHEELEKLIENNSMKRYNSRMLHILDVKVIPEAAGIVYNIPHDELNKIDNQDILIIDVGGRTTDVCLQKMIMNKRVLSSSSTHNIGAFNIYEDIISYINETYTTDFKFEDAEDIIKNGLYVDGEKQNIDFVNNIACDYFMKLLKDLNIKYNLKSGYIYLTGGGSNIFKNYFLSFKNCILSKNVLFDNAKSYEKVGKKLWVEK